MEIERKFIINKLPFSLDSFEFSEISQSYVSTDPVIRIRRAQSGDRETFTLTCKGRGLMMREELNIPIDKSAYLRLMAKKEGRIIQKFRYLIPLEGKLTCELDVFTGDLAPLRLAEVEFDSKSEARSFTPPAWFGREVTGDSSYQNASMVYKNPC